MKLTGRGRPHFTGSLPHTPQPVPIRTLIGCLHVSGVVFRGNAHFAFEPLRDICPYSLTCCFSKQSCMRRNGHGDLECDLLGAFRSGHRPNGLVGTGYRNPVFVLATRPRPRTVDLASNSAGRSRTSSCLRLWRIKRSTSVCSPGALVLGNSIHSHREHRKQKTPELDGRAGAFCPIGNST
jgi:hypothetical protein